jgi:hypothetical protein
VNAPQTPIGTWACSAAGTWVCSAVGVAAANLAHAGGVPLPLATAIGFITGFITGFLTAVALTRR